MTKENLNRSGVYQITCMENARIYVGSAANIRMRWKLHRTHLRMGISHNKPMQHAWDKYGEHMFTFEVLEFCEPTHLADIEQKWLDSTQAFVRGVGFNVLATAYSSVGLKHSPETIRKLSEMASARDHSHLRLLNEARRGLPSSSRGSTGILWTDEQKAFASSYRKGKPAWNKGIPHTDEAKQKISASSVGLNRKYTDLQRDEVKRLRLGGMTYSAIAIATNMSLSICHKIANNNTGKYKPIGGMRSFDKRR